MRVHNSVSHTKPDMNSIAILSCPSSAQTSSLAISRWTNIRRGNYNASCGGRVKLKVMAASAGKEATPECGHMRAVSLYEVLGIERDAGAEDIKGAYRSLARRFHPDAASAHAKEESTSMFLRIHDAYAVLSDPEARAQYDRRLCCPIEFPNAGDCKRDPGYSFKGRNWETDQCW